MKNSIKALVSVSAFMAVASVASAVTLTSFGNVASPTFSIDGSTTLSTTQNAASIDISGSDFGGILAGTFTSVDLGQDETLTTLYLSGSATTTPVSSFTITLFDSGFNTATFVGGSWTDVAGGLATLTYDSGSLDSSDIIGMQLDTAGIGSAIAASFTSLATTAPVPEPSTYAALSGLLAHGYVMVRRRR